MSDDALENQREDRMNWLPLILIVVLILVGLKYLLR